MIHVLIYVYHRLQHDEGEYERKNTLSDGVIQVIRGANCALTTQPAEGGVIRAGVLRARCAQQCTHHVRAVPGTACVSAGGRR